MTEARLTGTRIRGGIWEGVLTASPGTKAPVVEVVHMERQLPDVTLTPLTDQAGQFAVRVPIPLELLADGVQTFVIRDAVSKGTLGHFTVIAGTAMEDDIRAEIDLLRAELDMLKKAFRRHCLETM
ncbi:MAG: hypothetical protein Q7J57_04800 [Gemmobacter sp.]|nr:hypothetical protein [Gemmobacter sp.]